jgi:hypothetical protein
MHYLTPASLFSVRQLPGVTDLYRGKRKLLNFLGTVGLLMPLMAIQFLFCQNKVKVQTITSVMTAVFILGPQQKLHTALPFC